MKKNLFKLSKFVIALFIDESFPYSQKLGSLLESHARYFVLKTEFNILSLIEFETLTHVHICIINVVHLSTTFGSLWIICRLRAYLIYLPLSSKVEVAWRSGKLVSVWVPVRWSPWWWNGTLLNSPSVVISIK